MRRLRDLFRPSDRIRYLLWRAARSPRALEVGLANGQRLAMRPPPTTDLATAYEIFLGDAYRRPEAVPDRPVRTIVDVGANVGYSVLLWAAEYPGASIVAFEPHPAHLELVYRHVVANRLADRVRVVGAAAGDREGMFYLVERENESTVVEEPGPGRLPVRVRDFFAEVGPGPIDLLKIDIEGGEYAILGDPRFDRLDVRTFVLEWHTTEQHPDGRSWCADRLRDLGFEVAPGTLDYGFAGILWAWKPDPVEPVAAAAEVGGAHA